MKGILYLIELQKKNKYGLIAGDARMQPARPTSTASPPTPWARCMPWRGSAASRSPACARPLKTASRSSSRTRTTPAAGITTGAIFREGKVGSKRNDLSVTGWNYQALKAAKLSGLNIPNLHKAIDKCVKYLEGTQTKDGGFGAANREGGYNQWNLTGVSVLGLQTLGHGEMAQHQKGHQMGLRLPPEGTAHLVQRQSLRLVLLRADLFPKRRSGIQVLERDRAAGNPEEPGQGRKLDRHPAPTAGGDKIFSTALCTLMLEVYYRYLKVGDREEGSIFDRKN